MDAALAHVETLNRVSEAVLGLLDELAEVVRRHEDGQPEDEQEPEIQPVAIAAE